jgi:sugar lactone lactonase YvrE
MEPRFRERRRTGGKAVAILFLFLLGFLAFENAQLIPKASAAISFTTGQPASLVVGEPSFISSSCAETATNMCSPYGVAFDSSGNLFVADQGDNRVLEYASSSLTSNGPAASMVFGSTTFSSATCSGYISATSSGTCLGDIREIALDSSGDLLVSDYGSEGVDRLLSPLSTGMTGSLAVGGQGCQRLSNAICNPDGVALDSKGNLWVADERLQRVLEFQPPFTAGEVASLVIGAPNLTSSGDCVAAETSSAYLCQPDAIAFDSSGDLWVADAGYSSSVYISKVLEYVPGTSGCPSGAFCDGMGATLVLGSSTCPTGQVGSPNEFPSAGTLCGPRGIAFDPSGNVWVADTYDYRVLEFTYPFTAATVSTADCLAGQYCASTVIGQPDFTTQALLGASQTSVGQPEDLAFDPSGNLWVSDNYNNRVLEFSPTVTTSTSSSSSTASVSSQSSSQLACPGGSSVSNTEFGVCVIPSSIGQGGTVKMNGTSFSSATGPYVLRVTEPDGSQFFTEVFSYNCSAAPCTTTATFPTDFAYYFSGPSPVASTTQLGTYSASVCSYAGFANCATATFTVGVSSSSTTTTETQTVTDPLSVGDTPKTVPPQVGDGLGISDSAQPQPPPLSDAFSLLEGISSNVFGLVTESLTDSLSPLDSMAAPPGPLSDALHAADKAGWMVTVTATLNDGVHSADKMIGPALADMGDAVAAIDRPSFSSSQVVPSTTGRGAVKFSTSAGVIDVSALSGPTAGVASGKVPGYGFFSFKISGLSPGQTVTLTMTFPHRLTPGARWMKFDGTRQVTNNYPVTVSGNTMTMRLTDGVLPGDMDGRTNGRISDPGAMVATAAPASGPSNLALLAFVLAVMLCVAGILGNRRRRGALMQAIEA